MKYKNISLTCNIYISNCGYQGDECIKDSLLKHFAVLKGNLDIKICSKNDLLAGDVKDKVINDFISKADIIIPLLSVEYINECDKEIDLLDELISARPLHYRGRIFPVIVRAINWKYTIFGSYPLHDLSSSNDIDRNLTIFTENIIQIAEKLIANNYSGRAVHISPYPARAGKPSEYSNEKERSDLKIDDFQFGDTVFPIDGNSAEPLYFHEDHVLCRRIETQYQRLKDNGSLIIVPMEAIDPKKVYIIETKDKGLFAKIIDLKSMTKDTIWLRSVNRNVEDIELRISDIKVIWFIKRKI